MSLPKKTMMTQSASTRTATTRKMKRWKKNARKNKILPTLDGFMVNELSGDGHIARKKPDIWVSPTQMGMEKIRASTKLAKYFVEFASSSTVHGFNHLIAPHRHPVERGCASVSTPFEREPTAVDNEKHCIERFLTIAFIGTAFASLILLSLNFWSRYQNEATIFVVGRDYKKYDFTLPALVLCPLIRVNKTMFPDVFKRHGIEDTPEAREFFTFIANATYLNIDETPPYTAVKPEKWLSILWELKSDPGIRGPEGDREGAWIVTERGLCKIFCSTVAEYSSHAYWMQNNWTIVTQAAKLASFNYKEREVHQSFQVADDSVRISAYHPEEVPIFELEGMLAPYRSLNNMRFYPQEITSSSDVKSLSRSQRKCKMLSEGGLAMWPVYSRNMCILECRYQLIRKHCGCYPFFARPMPGIPVCGISQLKCIAGHRRELTRINATVAQRCRCYYNCDTTSYKPKGNAYSMIQVGPYSTVTIDLEFPLRKIRRTLLFGINDFLTSVGGAAGLFVGGSVISFVEFLYWATLRLYRYSVSASRKRKVDRLKFRI